MSGSANVSPRIAPAKDHPKRAITKDSLQHVWKQNAKGGAGHAESADQPKVCGQRDAQVMIELSKFSRGFCTMITVSARLTKAFVAQAIATMPSHIPPCRNAGP